MRVVFWGGPWHDRAVDITDPLPWTFRVAFEPSSVDAAADRWVPATGRGHRTAVYVMRRCVDPGRVIARRLGSPPTWPVYVVDGATEDAIERWHRAASRPVVDGPRSALRVLVDRDTAREARVAARGPLP